MKCRGFYTIQGHKVKLYKMNRLNILLEKLNQQACSQEELAELKKLMLEQEGKKMEEYLAESLQNSSTSIDNQHSEHIWQSISTRVTQENVRKITPAPKRNITWISAAAMISFLVMIGFLLFLNNAQPKMLTIVNPEGAEVKLITLPDSSQVWLNENSRMVYPEKFTSQERRVEMKGQAFFQVRKDIDRPFKVISRGIVTSVLGTSFDIQTNEPDQSISIALFTGKVEVSSPGNNKKWYLNPNQALSIKGNKTQLGSFDRNLLAIWRSKEMHFNENSLEDVLQALKKYFKDKKIQVNDQKILKESISGTFLKSDKLENILELICFSKGWDLEKTTNDSFLIKH